MEMPEGMNKLYEENHKLGARDLKLSLKVFNALNLMKEMSEALEKAQDLFGNNYPGPEESKWTTALNKFKEWK